MISTMITYLGTAAPGFETIGHAWDAEPVEQLRDVIPALYLFPGKDATQEDGTDYLTSKMVHADVHAYIVCANTDLEARKDELRTALIGWTAGAAYTDMALVSGNVLQLRGGIVWWQDIYRIAHTIRETY